MVNKRLEVVKKINELNSSLQVWQTEFGILGNICNQYHGNPRNTGIDYGLYVARVIHHDLTVLNASAWHWWLAVSPYDYSDALVYINAPSGKININECREDGIVKDSKQLWCMGNFSRFIRPGMKRIDLKTERSGISNMSSSLMISAYKDSLAKKVVVVIVNNANKELSVSLNSKKNYKLRTQIEAYFTSATTSLKRSDVHAKKINIPAMSVVTLVGKYT